MGNASSAHSPSHSRTRSGSRVHHQTAAASLSSFSTHLNRSARHQSVQPFASPRLSRQDPSTPSQPSQLRKRRSLELPDLEPSPVEPPPTSQLEPKSSQPGPAAAPGSHSDNSQFQLRLPPRTSRAGTPIIDSSESPVLTSVLDAVHLGNDHIPETPCPASFIVGVPPTLTVNPGAPPQDDQAGRTLPASPSLLQPDLDLPGLHAQGLMPAIFPASASSPVSLAPLQQPIETVVPPLPPVIAQPFPPPLPAIDADAEPPLTRTSTALTTAVTETVAAATAVVQAASVLDIGAGSEGVPTLLTWKEPATEVYVTGTFSKWKQQIKLRKPPVSDTSSPQDAFSALVALPPGPHRLKFIVDKRWKTSKYLPAATDDKGNLINYLQVNPGDQPFRGLGPRGIWSGYTYGNWSLGSSILEDTEGMDTEEEWTTEIPGALLEYEDYHDRSESESECEEGGRMEPLPGEAGFAAEPPKLPAQLKEGILNMASRLPEGTGDDNSLLPRPDHSVLNHLAASPIKQGLLSVGVTSRYKRKYLTTVYYKPVDL